MANARNDREKEQFLQFLRGRGRLNDVGRVTQILLDQLALGQQQRLDDVGCGGEGGGAV